MSTPFKISLVALFTSCFYGLFAQNIGINTSGVNADASAILDLNTGNTYRSPNGKGLFIPNVELTSATDATTIASPATSLLVYVPTGSGLTPAGYYYNSGTPAVPAWVNLSGATISCNNGNTLLGSVVQLGGPLGSPGTSTFTLNREIGLGGYNLTFSSSGGAGGVGINLATNTTPVSTLDDNGSIGTGIVSATTSYTLDVTSNTLLASAGTYTLTLPAVAAATRRLYNIVYNGTSTGIITIKGNGADNIFYNGVSANTLAIIGGTITLQSNGVNWYYVSGSPVLAHGTIKFYFTGALQYWVVPTGITQITVNAAGGAGGACGATTTTTAALGGTGAVFTASSWAVTAGHALYLVVGGEGNPGAGNQGGSGGGGTYIWDFNNISTSVNIVAGGGGGAAYTGGSSLTTPTAGGNASQTNFNTTPSGGAGGGAQTNEGSSGGGSGWNISGANGENGSLGNGEFTPGLGGGFTTNGTSWGGAAGTTAEASQYYIEGVPGAYGGGGGTGDLVSGNNVGGGGGGGWNGGNGGHSGNSGPASIGIGASSAINGATVAPTGSNTGNGYVTITW